MRTPVHRYTEEQREFMRKNIAGTPYVKMREMFNNHFGTDLTHWQISGFLQRNKFSNGNNNQFKEGHETWNKGMKGLDLGGEKGWFKKGHAPFNTLPIGTERVDDDGYTVIKIADPNVWQLKHRFIWEKVHGKVPEGHVLKFGDGDKSNIVLDNLILISRAQLALLNRHDLIQKDVESTKMAVVLADLHLVIGKAKARGKDGERASVIST